MTDTISAKVLQALNATTGKAASCDNRYKDEPLCDEETTQACPEFATYTAHS